MDAAPSAPPAGPAPRNLLLISIDTLRADALGVYDPARDTSPNLDAFARDAAVFEAAYSPNPRTAPSHMTMLTGVPPRVHGVANFNAGGGQPAPLALPTLAEILAEGDFVTGAFTGGANVSSTLGFRRGFQDWHQEQSESFAQKADLGLRWLKRVPAGDRWFLFLHTYEVHSPYLPAEPFLSRHTRPRVDADGTPLSPKELMQRAAALDPDALAACRELYQAEVAQMDAAFGEFLAAMQAAGHLDETLVVVTSDHGEQFGEHGGVQHADLWRELLHIPLLVRHPHGDGVGARVAARVRQMDLVPSVLDLLDVPMRRESSVTGASWAPWLRGAGDVADRTAIGERKWKQGDDVLFTIRDESHLLYWGEDGDLLFDLAADPHEEHDVAYEHPDVGARLLRDWEAWREEMDALAAPFAAGDAVELSAEQQADLEHLGYLDGDD